MKCVFVGSLCLVLACGPSTPPPDGPTPERSAYPEASALGDTAQPMDRFPTSRDDPDGVPGAAADEPNGDETGTAETTPGAGPAEETQTSEYPQEAIDMTGEIAAIFLAHPDEKHCQALAKALRAWSEKHGRRYRAIARTRSLGHDVYKKPFMKKFMRAMIDGLLTCKDHPEVKEEAQKLG